MSSSLLRCVCFLGRPCRETVTPTGVGERVVRCRRQVGRKCVGVKGCVLVTQKAFGAGTCRPSSSVSEGARHPPTRSRTPRPPPPSRVPVPVGVGSVGRGPTSTGTSGRSTAGLVSGEVEGRGPTTLPTPRYTLHGSWDFSSRLTVYQRPETSPFCVTETSSCVLNVRPVTTVCLGWVGVRPARVPVVFGGTGLVRRRWENGVRLGESPSLEGLSDDGYVVTWVPWRRVLFLSQLTLSLLKAFPVRISPTSFLQPQRDEKGL